MIAISLMSVEAKTVALTLGCIVHITKVKAILKVDLIFHDGKMLGGGGQAWNPDTRLRLTCSLAPTARVCLVGKDMMMI